MRQFIDLPTVVAPGLPRHRALSDEQDSEPLCGGCGAKVAPSVIGRMLEAQGCTGRDDILTGPGDDAAVIRVGNTRLVLTTDHLRGVTDDFGLLARIAALHAMGDIWAMGAQPQAALLSVTLPRMSETLQARSMAEIMNGAGAALRAAGAAIVGGHSTMGAETSIGVTLTGLLDSDPITLSGAQDGDALILTRPLGSGVLLAAEMRGEADGRDIERMFEMLQRPQDDAAAILKGAHAMTDVTGFGLAGHLMAMCRASGVAAVLDAARLPVYPGAETLARSGLHSTIRDANRAAAPVDATPGPRTDLMHDPQTAGGLLAAVRSEQAQTLTHALREAGHGAAIIGYVQTGPAGITLRQPLGT